jgi:peptidyl-prolyl cis-trans isomerase C
MSDSPVVASSGNATLHLDEINQFILDNPGLEISKIQLSNYIQRWSEKELIYQTAILEEFDKHPDIQKKIEELKKDFVVAAYLHEKIDSKLQVSDDEIRSYFNENSSEFIRENDFYNLQLMLVKSSTEAYQIQQKLLDGEDFETLAKQNSMDASKDKGGKMGWIPRADLPHEVSRVLSSLPLNTVSTPIRTPLGYYLIQVQGVREKGQTQTLEEVKDIIEWRILAKNREDGYKDLVNQLKGQQEMNINWNYLDSLNLER